MAAIRQKKEMKTEIATFDTGTYTKRCQLYKDIMIGSVGCTGHTKIKEMMPCKYLVSYKEENSYYLPIMKENISIVSEVLCKRPVTQLELF